MEEIEDVVILSDDEDIQDVIEGDFKRVKLENDVPAIKLVRVELYYFSLDPPLND